MIILDTNVFVGACMGTGASAKLIELCIHGKIVPAMGSALLAEYEDVISREFLFKDCHLNLAQREELLDILLESCKWVKTYFSWRPNSRDEGDNHVIELAVAAAASHIVTWNTRDFASMELRFPLLRYNTPPEFLKELSS
jgi:putative PIN family toxin of toxin-antitoxin system